ncbi:hypothetical protein [Mucilaginibacter gossypiicola]|uniref:hypothetical protein n=1 Tax=Mucilaginibacter gossypiicola TaxID=551995 RepID=UPI000B88F47E|nr:hypothetical protein [Mucilaginibacter gossypiicola]
MESQHSINTILSFGAKSVKPEILEQLLVGRSPAANYLFKSVEGIVKNGNNQQILVIGQRGMGKTHLLRVLYHRCQSYIKNDQLVVAYFAEEEYGVANYFDFLIRILYALIRWEDIDKNTLESKLEELQDTNIPGQVSFAERIIEDYIADKPLLILAENFGDILNAIGTQEQGKLRAWMYQDKRINIIATSQSISDDFDKEDRPFYGFFNLYYLKSLTYKDSLLFLTSLAELDDRPDVVEHLKNKGKAQVKAIYELVKGNHRLLVTFYEFLKSDTLAKLSNHFIKTINDLKPYYETYIRYLPPQQQKIIRYIALSRKPQQGTIISKNCFIDQKSLSKQLSELVRKRLIEAITDQTDKRNKLYDINEPLLRISIEVGEHKEGITALFIDFLAIYYDENELTDKKLKFSDLLEKCESSIEKKEFQYEIQAIEKALSLKRYETLENTFISSEILNILFEVVKQKKYKEAFSILEREKHNIDKLNYSNILFRLYMLNEQYLEAKNLFLKFSDEFVEKKRLFALGALSFSQLVKTENSESFYLKGIEIFEKAEKNGEGSEYLYLAWGNFLAQFATIFRKDEDLFFESFSKFEKAIEYNSMNENIYIELAQWQFGLSIRQKDSKFSIKAFENFEAASDINPKNIRLFKLWGGALGFSSDYNIKDDSNRLKNFKGKFKLLSFKDRVSIWKIFSNVPYLYLLNNTYSILKIDIKHSFDELQHVLVDWINAILSSQLDTLNKADLTFLRKIAIEFKDKIPELAISEIYIDTYEDYKLNGNKNAIYELPKEQRLFFESKILKQPEL